MSKSKTIKQRNSTSKKVEEWSVEEVCEWLKELKLQEKQINGEKLVELTNEQIKQFELHQL